MKPAFRKAFLQHIVVFVFWISIIIVDSKKVTKTVTFNPNTNSFEYLTKFAVSIGEGKIKFKAHLLKNLEKLP